MLSIGMPFAPWSRLSMVPDSLPSSVLVTCSASRSVTPPASSAPGQRPSIDPPCAAAIEETRTGKRTDTIFFTARSSPLGLLDLLHQRRHHLEQIPHDPVIRHFEYGRFRIFVD